jgi:hypothetical protein
MRKLTVIAFALLICVCFAAFGAFASEEEPPETPENLAQRAEMDEWVAKGNSGEGHIGAYSMFLEGDTIWAEGYGEFPLLFVFPDYKTGGEADSTVQVKVSPLKEDTSLFYRDWGATVESLTKKLHHLTGEKAVNFVSHDQIYRKNGNIYVFYFELWESGRFVPVTLAWRFFQSYYVTAMGVNFGDKPEVFEISKYIAKTFKDYTLEPLTGEEHWQRAPETLITPENLAEWEYSVPNPFTAVWEYLYDEGGPFYLPPPPFDWGEQEPKPAGEIMPDAETFIERYNIAAEEVGALAVEPEKTEDLMGGVFSKGGPYVVEGGFAYDFEVPPRDASKMPGNGRRLVFDPLYTQMLSSDGPKDPLPAQAAVVSAITKLPVAHCLRAIEELAEEAFAISEEKNQADPWGDSEDLVGVASAVLEGVALEYQYNWPWGVSRLTVNMDGFLHREEINATRE